MHGANSERVSSSRDIFYLFLDTLRESDLTFREEIGGHSPVWAIRAQKEGCKVFTAAQSFPSSLEQLANTKESSEKYLLWPIKEIEEMAGPASQDKFNKVDLHLVFEYGEGDSILGGRFKAPRSNRFYFVHDPNGGKLKQLETYHKLAETKYPEITRHMFGGY
jgi:hypothetical protein